MSVKTGGRIMFVGDPKQAIYGFAGASCDSIDRIKDVAKASELPLSVCYRCPDNVLQLARRIVPHVETAPGKGDGVVEYFDREKVGSILGEGDIVLCRTNAPLLSLCYSLISAGVQARVKGRDIGKGLTKLIDKLAKKYKVTTIGHLEHAISKYLADYTAAVLAAGGDEDDARISRLGDQADCIRAIIDASDATTVDNLKSTIDELFSDAQASIWLSSVHRAKGLEADRVFIIRPEQLPPRWSKPGTWQYEQELNLKYVAMTRAKKELWVEDSADATWRFSK